MVVSKYFYFKPGEFTGNITTALVGSNCRTDRNRHRFPVSGCHYQGTWRHTEAGPTAAILWYNAGVGMSCGAGMVILPIFCTTTGLASLTVLKSLEYKIPRDSYKNVHVECDGLGRAYAYGSKRIFWGKTHTNRKHKLHPTSQGIDDKLRICYQRQLG